MGSLRRQPPGGAAASGVAVAALGIPHLHSLRRNWHRRADLRRLLRRRLRRALRILLSDPLAPEPRVGPRPRPALRHARDFGDPASWEAYDAGGTSGLNTVCYYGAAFDGRYVVFTPRDDSKGYHSRVLRCDTLGEFKDPASWDAHEVDLPVSGQGVASDGRFLYFCPGYESVPGEPMDEDRHSGRVLRMDTGGDFHAPSTYRVFDTSVLSPEAVCFDGGAFDGRFIYLIPLIHGVVARHDPGGDFEDPESWETFDARPLGMKLNVGAVFDGRYLYFCAYGHSRMVRYDTRATFSEQDSWESYDAAGTSGLDTGGFDGGFFDGRFVYFCPWTRQAPEGESVYHSNFLRYDTAAAFDEPASWSGL